MPTRDQALNDIRVLVDWPAAPVPFVRAAPYNGTVAPPSFRDWLRIFGAREWLYVAGFADIVWRIPRYLHARTKHQTAQRFLEHVKNQRTSVTLPDSWANLTQVEEITSAAQVGKANQPGYLQMRFDKMCVAILCLDKAVKEVDPALDIFEMISICPVTYYLVCDRDAQAFLKNGSGPLYDQLVAKFVRHDPTLEPPSPVPFAMIPEDEKRPARDMLRNAAMFHLMTYTSAKLISDFVNQHGRGRIDVACLAAQPNLRPKELRKLYGELIIPPNGLGPLGPPKFDRAG